MQVSPDGNFVWGKTYDDSVSFVRVGRGLKRGREDETGRTLAQSARDPLFGRVILEYAPPNHDA
jgi:hypothetical protein